MTVTEEPATGVFLIHSPSIPMRLKDVHNNLTTSGLLLDGATLDPGHEAILEMHANSEASALFYVVVVLVLYVVALVAVLAKYLRTERYDNRLTRLYDEFMSRERGPPKGAADRKGGEEQKQSLVVNPEFVV